MSSVIDDLKIFEQKKEELSLEEQIQARKDLAKDFQLVNKLRTIADELTTDYQGKKHGGYNIFSDGNLGISRDTYACNISASYKGKRVVSIHLGKLIRFIPSVDFLTLIDLLYKQAMKLKTKHERRKAEEKNTNVRERWGL
ncbi:MAG: hypothetical protein ACTSO3_16690 [Candidatus Heimdallarchaeaceae archaeon]